MLHLPAGDPRRALYAQSKIYLCCGQGSGEEALLPQLDAMQAALEEEREALSQTAQRNASRYSEAEDATKDFVVK